jgi:hypothetical protein
MGLYFFLIFYCCNGFNCAIWKSIRKSLWHCIKFGAESFGAASRCVRKGFVGFLNCCFKTVKIFWGLVNNKRLLITVLLFQPTTVFSTTGKAVLRSQSVLCGSGSSLSKISATALVSIFFTVHFRKKSMFSRFQTNIIFKDTTTYKTVL